MYCPPAGNGANCCDGTGQCYVTSPPPSLAQRSARSTDSRRQSDDLNKLLGGQRKYAFRASQGLAPHDRASPPRGDNRLRVPLGALALDTLRESGALGLNGLEGRTVVLHDA